MLTRLNVIVFAALLACFALSSRADLVVRVEVKVKDANQKADDAKTTLSVETLAGSTGQFATKTTVGKQTIELKGNLRSDDGKHYRMSVNYSDRAEGSTRQVSTNLVVSPNKPQELGALVGADGENQQTLVLTLDDKPVK